MLLLRILVRRSVTDLIGNFRPLMMMMAGGVRFNGGCARLRLGGVFSVVVDGGVDGVSRGIAVRATDFGGREACPHGDGLLLTDQSHWMEI